MKIFLRWIRCYTILYYITYSFKNKIRRAVASGKAENNLLLGCHPIVSGLIKFVTISTIHSKDLQPEVFFNPLTSVPALLSTAIWLACCLAGCWFAAEIKLFKSLSEGGTGGGGIRTGNQDNWEHWTTQ